MKLFTKIAITLLFLSSVFVSCECDKDEIEPRGMVQVELSDLA